MLLIDKESNVYEYVEWQIQGVLWNIKNFKLDKLFASVNDYFNIKMALKGLV